MNDAARRQRILRKTKSALSRAVSSGQSAAAIERAAEDVRAAMLLLFKGQRELVVYKDQKSDSEEQFLANFECKTSEWVSKSIEEIVRDCQRK